MSGSALFDRLKMEAYPPMGNQEPAISPTGLECTVAAVQQRSVAGMRAALRMRAALAAAIAVAFALTLNTAASAARIVVNSLVDPGATGICALHDAIVAANSMTATDGCAAGTGNDTIQFRVTGVILLAGTLPQVIDGLLTINGPASQGITIDGGGRVQVMQVAPGATLKLKNLTIAHGFLLSGLGGGIYNDGTLTVTSSTFSGNGTGTGKGGGGIGNDGTLTVTNSTFPGGGSDEGGGILNDGTATVTNSFFSGQGAKAGGGIWNNGTLTVTNSTFSDGNAEGGAGGIFSDGTLTVTNSTFSGNSSALGGGGGIANETNGTLTVTSSTFSGNDIRLRGSGSGIYNLDLASLKNNILAGNTTSGGGPNENCAGSIADAGFNISDDTSCGFAKTGSANNGDGIDPLLSRDGLANNGGPTKTIALASGSPAIDAIPVADCTDQASPPKAITTDQRALPRPDRGEDVCDIGAYESRELCRATWKGELLRRKCLRAGPTVRKYRCRCFGFGLLQRERTAECNSGVL